MHQNGAHQAGARPKMVQASAHRYGARRWTPAKGARLGGDSRRSLMRERGYGRTGPASGGRASWALADRLLAVTLAGR